LGQRSWKIQVERGKRERKEGEGKQEANRKRREPDAPNSKRWHGWEKAVYPPHWGDHAEFLRAAL
jgi:hypothetical protein